MNLIRFFEKVLVLMQELNISKGPIDSTRNKQELPQQLNFEIYFRLKYTLCRKISAYCVKTFL
jgi:hypothetical protein